jgi:N-acetylmuramoyl-L-alanine amidase
MSKYLWILDPGHGGRNQTEGKRSPKWADGSQYFEGEGNRDIAKRVANLLTRKGIRYVFTVSPDDMTDVPLPKRTDFINGMNLDRIVVSIHSDGFDDPAAHGHTVYTSEGETDSDKIASVFNKHAEIVFKGEKFRKDTKDGDPDKESQFWILRKTNCMSILLENFFHTNERECKQILMSESGKDKIAQYIVDSIVEIEATWNELGLD